MEPILAQAVSQLDVQGLDKKVFIGQAYPSGNIYLECFRGKADCQSLWPKELLIVPLDDKNAVLKKTRRSASIKNTVGPVKLAFEVPAHGETVLVVDLVVTDFSDHPPQGYELGIKGYELYTNGKLVGKIPPG